ncbi:MAG: LPD7 domain-containing protein [Pseudoalteromonas prydzensis]|uniref:LPD7 domain-containing protein n=1 Tax=Pseudoalteromonas prydzensis TaxID=182141 RepID=UPI003F9AADFB
MLARVTSGQTGIGDYLVNGVKSDRDFSRDELDNRVCIDGNLSMTENIIKSLNDEDKKENYYHITLSFSEKDLDENKIIEAYNDYKKSLMSAYSDDEYNVYAEIHFPKIKSYKNKKTGETVERLPHVHMVIPQKNLLTDKSLKPFGRYSDNIKYHDAIQESVNRKHNLISPYDNQRAFGNIDKSDFISRYKGDTFKGSNSDLKTKLFEDITNKNINTLNDFKKELSNYGEVSTGKKGQSDEYFQVKLKGQTKNIRLKESCFKAGYIEQRELKREKPSDKEILKNLSEWKHTRSHEMKHIHPASPKVRNEYYNLKAENREEYLNDRRNDFASRYRSGRTRTDGKRGANNIRQGGRATNREFGIARNGGQKFTDQANGLPNLPQRNVDGAGNRQQASTKSVLQSHEHNNLEFRGADRDNKLRWPDDRSRGGRGRGRVKVQGSQNSYAENLYLKTKNTPEQINKFKEIRKNLDPNRVLNHFEKTHGLVRGNYKITKAKDGSPRIKVGNTSYNVSDFCTKHMNQDWQSTSNILKSEYKKQLVTESKKISMTAVKLGKFSQLNQGLKPQQVSKKRPKKHIDKQEQYTVNSIVFASNFITKGENITSKAQQLNHSVRILRHLQRQENYGDKKMAISDLVRDKVSKQNIIGGHNYDKFDLNDVKNGLKKQQELLKTLNMKMGDLIPAKNLKTGKVEFSDKNTGKSVFTDIGSHLLMNNRKPDINHVSVAMTFAAEKFGKVEIKGTNEFKQQAIDVAVAKNLDVIFADKKMQERFVEQKAAFNSQNENATQTAKQETVPRGSNSIKGESVKLNQDNTTDTKNTESEAVQELIKKANAATNTATSEPVVKKEPLKLVEHGAAPFQNDPKNTQSYFVKTSDGQTHWGVGLKDAINVSGAKTGDEISINKEGSRTVEVDSPIFDAEGKKIGSEKKNVERVDWNIQKQQQAKQVENNKPVTLLAHGEAPKNNDPRNSDSYFIKTSDGKTHWDMNLKDAVAKSGVKTGDEIVVNSSNPRKVEVETPVLDREGQKIGAKKALSERFDWSIEKFLTPKEEMKKDDKPLIVSYKWSEKDAKMNVTINGEKPDKASLEAVNNIKANDKFLNHYSVDDILKGKLDLAKANGVQPVQKTFNQQGIPMDMDQKQTKVAKNTQ